MNENPSNLSREHMRELWRRMTDIFGAQWSSQHGEIDHDDTWLRGLSNLTAEQISIGLTACANMQPDENGKFWAPSLPQFKDMCVPKDTKPAYHEHYLWLPKPKLTDEQKAEVSRKLRAALKGNPESPDPQEAASG